MAEAFIPTGFSAREIDFTMGWTIGNRSEQVFATRSRMRGRGYEISVNAFQFRTQRIVHFSSRGDHPFQLKHPVSRMKSRRIRSDFMMSSRSRGFSGDFSPWNRLQRT